MLDVNVKSAQLVINIFRIIDVGRYDFLKSLRKKVPYESSNITIEYI